MLSHVRLFATPWTVAHHFPLSVGFSRQKYWSGLPFPSPIFSSVQSLSHVRLFATPCTVAYQVPLSVGPGKNTRVGCHALLQGIFPTLGLNPGLPHCWQTLYHLSHKIVFTSSQYHESVAYFVPGTFPYDDMASLSEQPIRWVILLYY